MCKQGSCFYVGELGAHDQGQGVGPLATVSSVKRDIPAGTLMTMFGGVTLEDRTQRVAYESFTRMHADQHNTDGEEKFQYSVSVGSEQDEGSLSWMVPVNDFRLLDRLIGKKANANKSDRELKTLTEEGLSLERKIRRVE